MTVVETPIPGVLLFTPPRYDDARGFFRERYHAERYAARGLPPIVQENHSRSKKGVLRGLHFQREQPQGKLVECVRGQIYDVVVDLRAGSPAYGRHFGVALSGEDGRQLWVPPGLAHGFCVRSPEADVLYGCSAYYRPGDEGGVVWDDPDLGIFWPVEEPTLSDKDRALPRLRDLSPADLPQGGRGGE